jgi:F0F1-type ATP synthase alpha subunit
MLKQAQYVPMALDKQVMSLWAAGAGKLDRVAVQHVKQWEAAMHTYMDANHAEIGQAILRTKDLPVGDHRLDECGDRRLQCVVATATVTGKNYLGELNS